MGSGGEGVRRQHGLSGLHLQASKAPLVDIQWICLVQTWMAPVRSP